MLPVRRSELQGKLGRSAEQRVGTDPQPLAGAGALTGSGQGLANDEALIRLEYALVVAFGQGEAARLVEVILRVGEFGGHRGRFGDRAIAAGGAGADKVQGGDLSIGPKNQAAVGSQTVGHSAGDESL